MDAMNYKLFLLVLTCFLFEKKRPCGMHYVLL